MRAEVMLVVTAMAAVTLTTRVIGVWAGRGPLRRHLTEGIGARLIDHLPGAVLVSILAPTIARGGIDDALAAALGIGTFLRTRNALASVAVGVLAAAALRRALGG